MRPKAMVLGASGQVGQALMAELASRGWEAQGSYFQHPEAAPGLFHLDLGDVQAVEQAILTRLPQAVFLPSGWTWVDGCEDDPARAFLLNAQGPEAAAKAAAALQIPLVDYSTEYVFGERGGPYDELRAPDPLGVYGASKLRGEELVRDAWPAALIVRTTVVYGPEPQGKNFVHQLIRHLSAGKPMQVPQDQVSSPTYNRDLARASVDLVERRAQGIWNVAGPERLDRFAFARLAARIFGLDASLLTPVQSSQLAQMARRPLDAGLDIGKLVAALGWTPLDAQAGLEAMREAMGWTGTGSRLGA